MGLVVIILFPGSFYNYKDLSFSQGYMGRDVKFPNIYYRTMTKVL